MTSISDVTSVGLWIGGVLLLVQLYRAPEDLPLRYFTATVLLLALQNTMVSDQNATSAVVRLLANLIGVAAGFAKVGFFLTALGGRDANRVVWRREAAIALLVMLVGTTAWALAPAGIRAALGQPRNGGHPAAFVFVFVIILYLASVSVRTIAWTVRLVPRLKWSAFRAGLILIGIAAFTTLCSGVLKLVSAVVAVTSAPQIPAVQSIYPLVTAIVPLGYVAFFLGAIAPLVDGAAQALAGAVRNRSTLRLLEPLWSELHGAFPNLQLRTRGGPLRRTYRRVVEIRDGMVQLAPYYDRAVADSHVGDELQEQALLVRTAIANHRADRPVPDPHPIPQSGAGNWQDEVDWLVRLASAFAATPAAPGVR